MLISAPESNRGRAARDSTGRATQDGTKAGGRDRGVAGPDHRKAPVPPIRGMAGRGAGCTVLLASGRSEPPAFGSQGMGGLALAVEEAGYGAVVEDLVDRAGEQRGDGQHSQLVERLLLSHRQR